MRPLLLYGELAEFFKAFVVFDQITILADAHRVIFYPCFVVAVINVIEKFVTESKIKSNYFCKNF
jgi:hypothetical protein